MVWSIVKRSCCCSDRNGWPGFWDTTRVSVEAQSENEDPQLCLKLLRLLQFRTFQCPVLCQSFQCYTCYRLISRFTHVKEAAGPMQWKDLLYGILGSVYPKNSLRFLSHLYLSDFLLPYFHLIEFDRSYLLTFVLTVCLAANIQKANKSDFVGRTRVWILSTTKRCSIKKMPPHLTEAQAA